MYNELNVKKIKELVGATCGDKELILLAGELLKDSRVSVQKIALKIMKDIEKANREIKRVENLWAFEEIQFSKGYSLIGGIDEAGRGPLAGPVVASVVVLPKGLHLHGIDDSKKINEPNRERLFKEIQEHAIHIGTGIVDEKEIDKIGILNATKLAMKLAIEETGAKIDFLLIDAVKLDDISIEQLNIIRGDSKSISIACASIIAKVTRDRIMYKHAETYTGYNFENNKGYGTLAHYEGIDKYGISPIHRLTFLKNRYDVEL